MKHRRKPERPPAVFALGPKTAHPQGLAGRAHGSIGRWRSSRRLSRARSPSSVGSSTRRSCGSCSIACRYAARATGMRSTSGPTMSPRRSNPARSSAGRAEAMAAREDLRLREVEVQALDAARLEPLIGPERIARYEGVAEATESAMRAGRSSTSTRRQREEASPRCCRRCWPTDAVRASTSAGS